MKIVRSLLLVSPVIVGFTTESLAAHRWVLHNGVIVGTPLYYEPYYAYPVYPVIPPPPGPYYYPAVPYVMPPPTSQDSYYYSDNARYCREYTRSIIIGGAPQRAYGHACRQRDGSWEIID